MSLLVQLHSIKCLNETSELSASDEVYVLVTVANLRRLDPDIPAPPNFQVFSYGVFEDMDDDDDDSVVVDGSAFWGMDGTPQNILDPAEVAIVVSVMEHDNGTVAQYAELLNVRAAGSLLASLTDANPRSRATRLTADLGNVLNSIDVPIPFYFDDDHIATKQLRLEAADIITGGRRERTLRFEGDGGEYQLVFRISFQGWQHNVLSVGQALVAPTTSPTAWYTPPDTVQHVAYVGADQLIHECFFFIGAAGGWLHNIPGQAK